MGKFSKWNNYVRYLLMVIDVFSKFGWIEPLKNKKGETVVKAFNKILKTGGKPKYLWSDKGVEFYNKGFKTLLEEEGIKLYSTENEEKSSVVERWNRTIKIIFRNISPLLILPLILINFLLLLINITRLSTDQ